MSAKCGRKIAIASVMTTNETRIIILHMVLEISEVISEKNVDSSRDSHTGLKQSMIESKLLITRLIEAVMFSGPAGKLLTMASSVLDPKVKNPKTAIITLITTDTANAEPNAFPKSDLFFILFSTEGMILTTP